MIINLFSRKKLRTVFFGTPEFSVPSLEASASLFDLKAVVTQPDRPRGRGHKVLPCEVKAAGEKLGLPTFSPESLRKDSEELIRLKDYFKNESIDLFVVLAYGNILPEWILEIPKLGAVNLHASLLPRWRGAAPIQRAIETGDNSTGVSLQKMVQKLDAGDVLLEKRHLISATDNAEDLSNALSKLSADVLNDYFSNVFKRKLEGVVQDESLVTYAAKITKEEAAWSPSWSSEEMNNKVRAFYVWPQVKATLVGSQPESEAISITKTNLVKDYKGTHLSPGQILLTDGRVFLGTSSSEALDPMLELVEIKPANKGAVKAWDYLQNHAAQDSLTLQ